MDHCKYKKQDPTHNVQALEELPIGHREQKPGEGLVQYKKCQNGVYNF